MEPSAGKLAGGLALLALVWVGVYWWWPADPPISYATPGSVSGPSSTPDAPTPGPGPEPRPVQPAPVVVPPDDHPASPVAVVPPQFIRHVVKQGETFATIAASYYARNDLADVIAKANPLVDPTRLKPGRVILVPKDPGNIQGTPRTPPPTTPAPGSISYPDAREHTIASGDTLSGISLKYYGTTANAMLIFEANKSKLKSPDDLRIGVKLVIPPASGPSQGPG